MKSTIRVDYKSRYGDGNFGDKEPLVRVEVESSDDPRDTLLGEIFQGDFCNVGASLHNPGSTGPRDRKVYSLYKKTDSEYLHELAGAAYKALAAYSSIDCLMVTSSGCIYFQYTNNYNVRSKGVDEQRQYISDPPISVRIERDDEFIKRLVDDWKDFEKVVKEYQQNLEINLENSK